MKKIALTYLFLFAGLMSINIASAVTAVTADAISGQGINASTTVASFGLAGIIDDYDTRQNLIIISGQRYKVSSKGNLSDDDLTVGKAIKYNIEQSSDGTIGRVTRIWIEE
ncbi:hypothetical protein A9Q78_01875 [Methylophaga sp. 41_12_T18]|nr:hypothetical protein A9Q78_01875 [Methylophaga sp. 41_12_T18]